MGRREPAELQATATETRAGNLAGPGPILTLAGRLLCSIERGAQAIQAFRICYYPKAYRPYTCSLKFEVSDFYTPHLPGPRLRRDSRTLRAHFLDFQCPTQRTSPLEGPPSQGPPRNLSKGRGFQKPLSQASGGLIKQNLSAVFRGLPGPLFH